MKQLSVVLLTVALMFCIKTSQLSAQQSKLLSGIIQIDVDGGHTCAVDRQGNAYCWGSNGNGQLGWHQLYSPVDVIQ